ncbi:Phage tail protein [Fimbriiglobus ruber]|uniref:Phage tail protein n=1 Tax=Fimbriiglobus ruber TaxID=1908690 RepID=A0A225DNI1_9BACT|nr:Phage tail protein [Fimbriiglobus ruber]
MVETLYDAISAPFDKLKEFGNVVKTATQLGVDPVKLQGMQQLLGRVGVEADQVGHVFAIMGKNIQGGGATEAETLNRLGLSLNTLKGQDYEEQFKSIAEGISKLPPGSEQAAAALTLFGKSGDQLLPVLQKGRKGIDDFIETQKKSGAILSNNELRMAAEASKAWTESKKQISAVWDGLVNRATLIAAPVIKLFAGVISKGFALFTPVFDWLGRAISKTSEILVAVGEVFAEWIDIAITEIKQLGNAVFAYGSSWPSVESVVLNVFKTLGQGAGYVWDSIKAGAGAISYVTSFVVEGFGHLVDAFKSTIKDLLGIAGSLPDSLGGKAFRDAIPGVDAWGNSLRAAGDKMRDWGKGALNTWGDSAAKIGAWFDALANRRKTEQDAAKQLGKDVRDAVDYKPLSAALKGSKEAFSIEAKFNYDSKFGIQKKADEKNNEELKKINDKLNGIIRIWGVAIPLQAG